MTTYSTNVAARLAAHVAEMDKAVSNLIAAADDMKVVLTQILRGADDFTPDEDYIRYQIDFYDASVRRLLDPSPCPEPPTADELAAMDVDMDTANLFPDVF